MEENKTHYMPYANPSDDKVDLTYAFSITLTAGVNGEHLGQGALKDGLMGSDKTIQSGIKKYRDGQYYCFNNG